MILFDVGKCQNLMTTVENMLMNSWRSCGSCVWWMWLDVFSQEIMSHVDLQPMTGAVQYVIHTKVSNHRRQRLLS